MTNTGRGESEAPLMVTCPACEGTEGEWIDDGEGWFDFRECLPCKGFGIVTPEEAEELRKDISP